MCRHKHGAGPFGIACDSCIGFSHYQLDYEAVGRLAEKIIELFEAHGLEVE